MLTLAPLLSAAQQPTVRTTKANQPGRQPISQTLAHSDYYLRGIFIAWAIQPHTVNGTFVCRNAATNLIPLYESIQIEATNSKAGRL
jgi:hypothetical protein